jgi:tetratricopeptide (TPR) repeat protein
VAMGRYDAAGPVIESVLASADDDSEAAALARGTLGWARAVQGRWEEAVPLLRRAIRDADRLGDARRRAVLLRRLHWVELSRGELEAAVALAVEAREASRGVGDVAADAKCSMAIGQARIAQGLWEEGIAFLQATIDSLGTIGDRHCEAEALWLKGQARMEMGENEEARQCLERALEMIREIGDRDDEFRILTDLAACMRVADDLEGALETSEQAERIAAELGNENGIASARLRRAKIALSSGDAESAAAMAETAAETLERNRSGESWRAWWVLGEAHAELGGLEAGLDAMTRAVGKLDRIRGQIDGADRDRREAITGARRPEVAGLVGLLRRMGRDAEAARVAQAWTLEPGVVPHPDFARRAKRSSA